MSELDITHVKTLLGLTTTDQDDLLTEIVNNTTSSLLIKLNRSTDEGVPTVLNYVVTEVSVIRYNRRKQEGMKSYGQEGESITFADTDFDPYLDDIADWIANNTSGKTLGKLSAFNPYYAANHREDSL